MIARPLAFGPDSPAEPRVMAALTVSVVIIAIGGLLAPLVRVWFQTRRAGYPVPLLDLILMRCRHVNVRRVVTDWRRVRAAGIELRLDAIEAHALAGGRTSLVADAMITGVRAGFDRDIDLWNRTTALDLCGLNVRFMMDAAVAARSPALFDLPSPLTDDPRARQFDDAPRFG